jgi:hypothetical protein
MGTKRKWVDHRPPVPEVWPVLKGTKLTKVEILRLEEAGFQLEEHQEVSPRRLFGDIPDQVAHAAAVPPPTDANIYPTLRDGRRIRRQLNGKVSVKQKNRWESADIVNIRINSITMLPYPAYGCIVLLQSKKGQKTSEYRLTLGPAPDCSCGDFKDMLIQSRKRGAWYYCKHLYYIFRVVCKFRCNEDLFIHSPTFSFNEIKRVLEGGVLNHM